ncbi:MAG: Flp pilus assembly protein CpaB [Pseudomonadales bacterium]|jgi:pilus assembly protein CpaB|nr:Flp pilus assembly protein CpaB [Pseudomonadales bacterium]
MNRKILLAVAIVAGLGAAFLVKQHIDELVGDTITVYKATSDKSVGATMGSDIEAITLPAGLFPDVLEEAPDQNFVDYIEVTPLRSRVAAGDILLFRHFDSSVDPGVLPSIPAGKKAISIEVDQASAVSYFIQPKDLVDVMGTFYAGDDAQNSTEGGLPVPKVSTRPILQAVEVLAVGSEYRASERQKMEPYGSVTLLVSIDEAAKLIFARDYYNVKLTLILRSKDDTDVSSQLPEVGISTSNFDEIGNQPSRNVIIKAGSKE